MDDCMLITCSEDGSICLWTVKPPKGVTILHKNTLLPDDILISTKCLKQKIDRSIKLNLRLKELTKETAQNMMKLIQTYDGKVQKINDNHEMITMRRIEKEDQVRLLVYGIIINIVL